MTIDLIIPVRNGARFIEEALESARCQTVPPTVIYVVDDGSTDGTPEIVENWAARSSVPVKLIRKSSGGVSSARNAALLAGGSEFVAFLDADDVLIATHHEQLLNLIRSVPRAVVAFGDAKFFPVMPGNRPTILSRWANMFSDGEVSRDFFVRTTLLHGSIVPTCANLVRREAIKLSGLFDERLAFAEDRDFWLRLSGVGPFAVTKQVIAQKRIHDENVTADHNNARIAEGAIAVCTKFLRSNPNPEERSIALTALADAYYNFLYASSLSSSSDFVDAVKKAFADGRFRVAFDPRHLFRHLRYVGTKALKKRRLTA